MHCDPTFTPVIVAILVGFFVVVVFNLLFSLQLDLHFSVCICENQPSPGLGATLTRSGLHSGSWGERGKILKTDKFQNVGSGGGEKSKLP